jgi:hypothetical protein
LQYGRFYGKQGKPDKNNTPFSFTRVFAFTKRCLFYTIPKQTDTVRAELSLTSSDTLKMLDYYYLTSYYTELNKDSSLYFAKLQLQYAQKLNQRLWEGDAFF